MRPKEVARQLHKEILPALVGEQFSAAINELTGELGFHLDLHGACIELQIEPLMGEHALLMGHHVIGTRVLDHDAANRWVAKRNQDLRLGRVEQIEDSVVFFMSLIPPFDTGSVRVLLGVLAGEANSLPGLAAVSGALSLSDAAAIHRMTGE